MSRGERTDSANTRPVPTRLLKYTHVVAAGALVLLAACESAPSVGDGPYAKTLGRAIPKVEEATGLKFPHDVHLAPAGVKSPRGDVRLECASCHLPDAAGVRFEPVSMQAHCAVPWH